jgi:GNAT superfamily N-acetyltransferase
MLFETRGHCARELTVADAPLVQELFEANPDYFFSVNGRAPASDEARREFADFPPVQLGFSRRWFAGLFGKSLELEGIVVVVSDLSAPGVWHIAFFLIATRLHGTGVASEIYGALEEWAFQCGASWLRLGVVKGSTQAERFWLRQGFREVRTREGVETGGRLNIVRVLVKPLGKAGLAEYLEKVPRDRPGSPLP